MRVAAYAGLDADERALVAGGTMAAVLDGGGPPAAQPPRLARVRPASGSLTRAAAYLLMGFGAVISSPPPDARPRASLDRARPRRLPRPGSRRRRPALERIDDLLAAAEQPDRGAVGDRLLAIGLIHAAATIAATEPLE
jgi:hypothetical protein